jgi:hypothetical protein
VAAANRTSGPRWPESVGEQVEFVPGLERSLLDAGALRVLDALLGEVAVDRSPFDCAG